ncbi:MAG: TIGR04086 family membrane protein [Actinomycetes bacterium]
MSTPVTGNHERDNRPKHSDDSGAHEVGASRRRDARTSDAETRAINVDRNNDGVDDTRQHTAAVPVSHTRDADDHHRRPRDLDPDTTRDHDRHGDVTPVPVGAERDALHQRQKETFGGMKFGAAFFGWLTATGMAVLLTALVAAFGAAFGLSTNTSVGEAANQASQDAQTVGITSAVIILVILLLAYYCGGYVAGRMARFNGAKQGVAVWLWAIIIAVIVAILGLIFGSQFDILANLNSFPRLPLNEGALTTTGIIAVVVALLAALAGAVLGGLAGMRYHRRIDRADYDAIDNNR